MQRYGKDFLKELLLPLINQWGREAVLHAIDELADTPTKEDDSHQRVTRRLGTRPKIGAFTLAQRASVEPEKKALLLDLARQFEHRTFLPSIGDVRAFLEMRGQDSRGLKQRPEAFRRVIRAVVEMPRDSLQQLVLNNENAGGPSQLGPLSDAIKFASAAVRSPGEPAQKDNQNLDVPSADGRNGAPIDRVEKAEDAAKSDQTVSSAESSSKRPSEEDK